MKGKYIYFVMLELHVISWDWNQHHELHRDHIYAKLDGEERKCNTNENEIQRKVDKNTLISVKVKGNEIT
jgi:hypothetical protein